MNANGEVDGTTWTSRLGPASFGLRLFEDGSHLIFEAEHVEGTTFRVTWGVLATGSQSPFAGQVFCIASGSGNIADGSWTFREFSRLDPCPMEATGTLIGCAR